MPQKRKTSVNVPSLMFFNILIHHVQTPNTTKGDIYQTEHGEDQQVVLDYYFLSVSLLFV